MTQTKLDALSLPLENIILTGLNPRQSMDKDLLKELSTSIREVGVLEPLIVRKNGKGYELIAGHRRLKAAKMAGLKEVPVVVKQFSDEQLREIMVLENLQREGLNPMEEALAIDDLLRSGRKASEIAKTLGKCEKWVDDRMKLLLFPDELKQALVEGKMGVSATVPLFQFLKATPLMNAIGKELVKWKKIDADAVHSSVLNVKNRYTLDMDTVFHPNDWNWTKHFDAKDCKKCKKWIKYGQTGGKMCLDRVCYAPKVSEARRKFKEEEEGPKEEKKEGLKHISDLRGRARELEDATFNTGVCQGCLRTTMVQDWSGEKVMVCLDTDCYGYMEVKAQEVRQAEIEAFRNEANSRLQAFIKEYKPVGLDPKFSDILIRTLELQEKPRKGETPESMEKDLVRLLLKDFFDNTRNGYGLDVEEAREYAIFKDIPWNDEAPKIEPQANTEEKEVA